MFECCDGQIAMVDTIAPDRTHRHAAVKLDLRPGLFNGRAKELYQQMIALADEISMDSRFISLFVMDTWS